MQKENKTKANLIIPSVLLNRSACLFGQQTWAATGQIKQQADLCAIDSPKQRTNWVFLPQRVKKEKKTNSFVGFFEESTARQSACSFS